MRTAVVTGGSGYVGSAIIEMLLARDFHVLNVSRTAVQKDGVENILCDLSDTEATRRAGQLIKERAHMVDVLIHAAAPPTTRLPLEDTPPESAKKECTIAVDALSILAEILAPSMPAHSTIVGVTTASLDKQVPEKNIGAYLPAKAALRELLNTLREQLKNQEINVHEVAPTFLPGGLNKSLPEGVRNLLARQKDGTIPTAKDVAEAVCTHIA